MTDTNTEKEMTPEERLNYLRERGILVETADDRRRKQIKDIMNQPDHVEGMEYEDLKFVHVPHDESLPLKELSIKVPKNNTQASGDVLVEELKPYFKALSKKVVDVSLFQDQATKNFASADAPQVSEEALRKVAEQGQVETFTMVHSMESNRHTCVNIYLDEVGMLKKLPLNKRAADFAFKAGFNPPPKFYGDIFLGRVKTKPVLRNVDFTLGVDTAPDAKWLQSATMENLEHQTAMNQITGRPNETQPLTDGENGVAKEEKGYSWTQTDEEVEIVVKLSADKLSSVNVKSAGLKVKYFPKKMTIQFGGEELLNMSFFASVDPDGCTWTLDATDKGTMLVVTCEKIDESSWPRIIA